MTKEKWVKEYSSVVDCMLYALGNGGIVRNDLVRAVSKDAVILFLCFYFFIFLFYFLYLLTTAYARAGRELYHRVIAET